MRRISLGALLVMMILGIAARAAPAKAGGGTTFDFHRRWFAPGQLAEGKTQFSDWAGAPGRVAQGPYFAYLIRGEGFIEPQHVPREAIRLGRVKMRRVEGASWEASIRFIVPSVRPGEYTISLCNVPCRSSSVGDLMGAWISIAATAEEAEMRNLEDLITARVLEQVSVTTSDLSAQLEQLSAAVASDQSPSITVGTELRLEPIEEQLARMSAEVRQLKARSDQGLLAWLWVAGWLVAGGLAMAWWRARRRPARPPGSPSGGRRLEEPELEALGVPVHLDRVPVPDLPRQ